MGGGGKGGSAGKTYDYYGSCGALICCGPVEELLAIQIDAKTVWPVATVWDKNKTYEDGDTVAYAGRAYVWTGADGNIEPPAAPWRLYFVSRLAKPPIQTEDSPNPLPITVEKYGQIDFYWGTADQELLRELNDPSHPRNHFIDQGHPPYRNQCFMLSWKFLWGRERQGAPNIEFVVRRKPVCPPSIVTAAMCDLDNDGQANPVAAEVELLTHPVFGAGLPDSRFSPNTAIEAGQLGQNDASKSTYYLSPSLNEQSMLRSVIAEMTVYRDGWWRFDLDGRFEPGRFPRNQAAPAFGSSNTIDDSVLVEEPELIEHDWSETGSEAVVKYTNAVLAYNADMVKATSGFSKIVVGEVRQKVIERQFVQRAGQASKYAQEYLKSISEPWFTGTLKIRRTRCPGVVPGGLFLLVHSQLGIKIVCRCIQRTVTSPRDSSVTIKFESDRGLAPEPYSSAVMPEPVVVHGKVELFEAFHVIQLPPSFDGGEGDKIAVLGARHDPLTLAMSVFFKKADSDIYYDLGSHRQFPVRGELVQAYPANLPPAGTSPPDDMTGTLLVKLDAKTVAADKRKVEETQSADAVYDNHLLCFLISRTDPSIMEIVTVISTVLNGANYAINCRRYRYGVGPFAFVAGDYAYIVHGDDVPVYKHKSFATFMRTGAPVDLRLVSSNPAAEGSEEEAGEYVDTEFHFADPYGPAATWAWIKRNGATMTDFTVECALTDTFAFHVDASDPTGDLIDVSVVARLGGDERTILTRPITPSSGYTLDASFVPSNYSMGNGDWAIETVVRDASGRVRRKQLTATPGGASVFLKLRSAPNTGTVIAPVPDLPSGPYRDRVTFIVNLTTSTPGATIEWQQKPINVSEPVANDWQVYTPGSPIVFNCAVGYTFGQVIFARSRTGTAGNYTYSTTVNFPYWVEA